MAPTAPTTDTSPRPLFDRTLDLFATLTCWVWFIFGFLLFFSWLYLLAAIFSQNPELSFQRLNSHFFKIFFRLVQLTAPRQKIDIDGRIAAISSSVIVCNHLSYLDPLLLVALFPRHKTIVKTRFFKTPIFGWMLKKSGYLPATSEGPYASVMISQMEGMADYLKAGGNLFIFPEGTRSRGGNIGKLNKGAFKIARMCKAPLVVLGLRNTDKLFTPGKFLFNTRQPNRIEVQLRRHIDPDYQNAPPSSEELEQLTLQALDIDRDGGGDPTKTDTWPGSGNGAEGHSQK